MSAPQAVTIAIIGYAVGLSVGWLVRGWWTR